MAGAVAIFVELRGNVSIRRLECIHWWKVHKVVLGHIVGRTPALHVSGRVWHLGEDSIACLNQISIRVKGCICLLPGYAFSLIPVEHREGLNKMIDLQLFCPVFLLDLPDFLIRKYNVGGLLASLDVLAVFLGLLEGQPILR